MKVILLLLCTIFALSSAVPVFDNSQGLDVNFQTLLTEGDIPEITGDEVTDETKKDFVEKLKEILSIVSEAINSGKELKEEFLEKVYNLINRFKVLKDHLGKNEVFIINRIKEAVRDYIKQWIQKNLGISKREAGDFLDSNYKNSKQESDFEDDEEDDEEDVKFRLREELVEILFLIGDSVDSETELGEEFFEKWHAILEKIKKLKISLGQDELFILNRIKDSLKIYKEKFGKSKRKVIDFLNFQFKKAESEKTYDEVTEELKNRLKEIMAKIKDAIDSGKAIKEGFLEKFNELREKLKNVDHGDEHLKVIGEKVKNFFKDLFHKLGTNKRDLSEASYGFLEHTEEDSDTISELKNKFNDLVKRVKDAYENGKSIADGLDKLQKLRKTLKDFNINVDDMGLEYLEKLKNKISDIWNRLKENLTSKRSADIDVFGILEELKREIKDKFDPEKIKKVLEIVFKKGNELLDQLTEILKEKGEEGKQKIFNFIDRILVSQDSDERRSVKDVYEWIKDYFKDLNIELKDKFHKFGLWVKEQYHKGLEKGNDKIKNIKRIAKEYLDDSKQISKDVAEQALEFFREYKRDLGIIYYDIKEKTRKILHDVE